MDNDGVQVKREVECDGRTVQFWCSEAEYRKWTSEPEMLRYLVMLMDDDTFWDDRQLADPH